MPKSALHQYVLIGYITKAHSLKGEVCIHPLTEATELFLGEIFLQAQEGMPLMQFKGVRLRMHHSTVLVTIQNITDRTQAEHLRRHAVYINRDKLPALPDDSVYLTDLIGLPVYTLDNQANALGKLGSIIAPAGQDIWVIVTETGHEILFPAVEEFIEILDIKNSRIVINPPPGLIDLYLEK